MNSILKALICLTLFLGPLPVAAQHNTILENREKMLEKAREAVPQITVQDLYSMIQTGEDFILLDVRDSDEWKAGIVSVDNLEKISRGMLEFMAPDALKQDDEIVVMCATGVRGALAAESLHKLGYTGVLNLEGGIMAWIEARYPIENRLGNFLVN